MGRAFEPKGGRSKQGFRPFCEAAVLAGTGTYCQRNEKFRRRFL
jgi:hypothetical protein